MLGVLWASSGVWGPWNERLPQGLWLNRHFLFGRDVFCLIVFWAMAFWYAHRCAGGNGKVVGAFLILAYALAFSMIGFDLAMGLDPVWYSSLAGGYFFISGLYAAAAAWTLLSTFRTDGTGDRLHDLGKLVVTFSILTAYLAYANLFVIWYENIPVETRFFVPRLNIPHWYVLSWVIVGVVYLGPLILLLTVWSKRTRWYLAAILLLVLAALFMERWWLVAPTFSPEMHFGWPEISAGVLLLGLMGGMMQAAALRLPRIVEEIPQP